MVWYSMAIIIDVIDVAI